MIQQFKIFKESSTWDEFHTLKSNNPKNPQLIYEREVDPKLDDLIYDLEPGAKILDLGCGDGTDSLYFQSKGFDVTALDLSSVVVDELNNKGVKSSVYDISEANIPGNYDLIYSRLSLHYFDRFQLSQILNDIKNKLNDGGCLYFTVKSQSFKDKIETGKKFLHKKEWTKILSYYFDDVLVEEHTGRLYNIPSQWLEFECYL